MIFGSTGTTGTTGTTGSTGTNGTPAANGSVLGTSATAPNTAGTSSPATGSVLGDSALAAPFGAVEAAAGNAANTAQGAVLAATGQPLTYLILGLVLLALGAFLLVRRSRRTIL